MPNFTIEGRMKTMKDVQRTWMWELIIPAADLGLGVGVSNEDLIIRCRSAVIPGRGNDPITSNFVGMQQFFFGKPTFGGNTFAVTLEETQDQKVTNFLYAWQQKIFDIELNSNTAGQSQVPNKRDAAKDIFLDCYAYDGGNLEKKFKFVNAWPTTVDPVTMDYTGNDSVKFSVTFQFDFWSLVKF